MEQPGRGETVRAGGTPPRGRVPLPMIPAPIAFRPLTRSDFGTLSRWFSAPHVQPWWREPADLDAIEARYGPPVDGKDPTEVFVVERSGRPIGLIQRYRFADNRAWQSAMSVAGTPHNAAGIDYLIGSNDLIGIGLGPQAIGRFVEETWPRYPDIAAIVVNVDVENRRSWRALEKVGFQRAWTGELDSDDPSDAGMNHVYVLRRPGPPADPAGWSRVSGSPPPGRTA